MTEKASGLEPDEQSALNSIDTVVEAVRRFAGSLLEDGVSPSQLSFGLTYVATEMGLYITRKGNALGVFQTVLQAVTSAALKAPTEEDGPSPDVAEDSVPVGATVH